MIFFVGGYNWLWQTGYKMTKKKTEITIYAEGVILNTTDHNVCHKKIKYKSKSVC